MPLRRCPGTNCPNLVQRGQRCPKHQAQHEAKRGTSTKRGYGYTHQALRRAWARKVQTGHTRCARCGQPIHPNEPWDLGHNDHDRQQYSGPEHQRCNRSAGGKQAHNQH